MPLRPHERRGGKTKLVTAKDVKPCEKKADAPLKIKAKKAGCGCGQSNKPLKS